MFPVGTLTGVILSRAADAEAACRAHAIVVLTELAVPAGRCLAITPERLRRSGTLALRVTAGGIAMEVTHPGHRLWSRDGVKDPVPFFAAAQ